MFYKCWIDIKNILSLLNSFFCFPQREKHGSHIFFIKDNVKLILLWGFVSTPIVWGFLQTFQKVLGLFRHGM